MADPMIIYASCLMNGPPGGQRTEKSLKRSKKFLTNEMICDNIFKLPDERRRWEGNGSEKKFEKTRKSS